MNMSEIIEKWDGILFQTYNFLNAIRYPFINRNIKKTIKKNSQFKNLHEGERCFIVLNGPSINQHDLSKLKDEIVFASNYFYNSKLCQTIKPNYYCWLDNTIFADENCEKTFESLCTICPDAKLFLNYKGIGLKDKISNSYFTYNKHIPNRYSLKTSINKMSSTFSTVALYAISIAIFMGFKDIYILGLDFEPGAFKHFENLGEGTECDDPKYKSSKNEVFGNYWSYAKSHSEFYKIANVARKKGVNVINLNKESCIRAFEFGEYEEII